jgi:predicted enzyme related to lactoylglutathione lyase
MKRVTGIGGIFFKAQDPKKLKEWYDKHLGITPAGDWGSVFVWRAAEQPNEKGQTVWSVFSNDTKYLDPGKASFMVNYRVENLHWLLEQLRKEGVQVADKIDESEFGKFAWIIDPEGNKIELWEPPKGSSSEGGIPMK